MLLWGQHARGAGTHGLTLEFAPYSTFRDSLEFVALGAGVCYVSQKGCKLVHDAKKADSNLRAFALWAEAYGHAGTAHRLESGFGGNPAVLWELKHPPLEAINFAIVYHHKSGKALRVTCTAHPASEDEPDDQCAIAALRRAYHNLVTR